MPPEINATLTRRVLENLRSPGLLIDHPWINSSFVHKHVETTPALAERSQGFQLAAAVAALFAEMIPGTQPKRGKRLDTQWGTFGILAAQYFAPFMFGLPYPVSLRDAWGKIDHAILCFRYGKERVDSLSDEELARYRLIGDELEVTPVSTISDWHVKGIEQLTEMIADRQQHLSHARLSTPDVNHADALNASGSAGDPKQAKKKGSRRGSRWVVGVVALLLLVGLIFSADKAWKIYQLAQVVRADLPQVMSLASLPKDAAQFNRIGPVLEKFHADLGNLRSETSPYLRTMGPWLRWIPDYGEDIAASASLLDFADQVVDLAQTTYKAAAPIYLAVQSDAGTFNPQKLTTLVVQAQPQLIQARQELDSVKSARAQFEGDKFSARTQALLTALDRPLGLLDSGLSVALALPKLLGAGSDGPQTYMILVQNEDELRPTGGFITSVGTFVVRNGAVFGLQFEDSGDQEDWSLPYPKAPWQLQEYMNAQVLVLRDANWFPDYPTSVSWVEYLYAYKHNYSVDGVIAIDQQMLVALLQAIGPVTVEGVDVPITAENVVSYMRAAKQPPVPQPANWYRKAFISLIGNAIVEKLLSGDGIDWQTLAEIMTSSLNERHMLLQLDDPQMTTLLSHWGWDGAVKAENGDFLLVVDSNIGFNKVNAVIDTSMTYDVDLSNMANPSSALVIYHTNRAESTTSCVHFGKHEADGDYPIRYCYWDYMRVYLPTGTQLLDATPQMVPADWMLLQQEVPARVDLLEDALPGLQGYGTLLVVPGGQTLSTSFEFRLPVTVIYQTAGSNLKSYTLKIQKQPGTIATPMTIRVHLPPSAQVEKVNLKALIEGANILVETTLRTDVILTVTFTTD